MASRLIRAIATGGVGLLLAGCGSTPSAGSAAPVATVTLAGSTVTATVTATRTATKSAEAEPPRTEVVTTSVNVTHTITAPAASATTAPAAATTDASTPGEPTTASSNTEVPQAKPLKFTGTGDDVVDVKVTDAMVLTFTCKSCSSNTVLKVDGEDGLLVNEIGAYSGRHLVNMSGDLTQLEVNADAPWTITLNPTTVLAKTANRTSGHGDDVVYYDTGTRAKITHSGEANFVVIAYSDGRDLLVNEIGNYRGTVPLHTPCIVQIIADGDWALTPS